MNELWKGIHLYLATFDDYFPPAWAVAGRAPADDLSNLRGYRSLICDFLYGRGPLMPGANRAAARQRFAEILELWTDPREAGWTWDYFASDILFPMPDPITGRLSNAMKYDNGLTGGAGVSASERPMLADVNASLPNSEARDPRDPEHEGEMRKGFSVVQAAGIDVFVGVGPSLRRAGDYDSSRFDFRHSSGFNVLFLDGHVECIKADDGARLERVHRYWNSIEPGAGPGSAPR